nr:tRNA pseudouridine synthase-like 1 isoform X2 [Onthophagus taurus]
MRRYLINLSYIGTGFRGIQRQTPSVDIDDPTTIQGQIEMGLKLLKPSYMSSCAVSSRTDAGVHALHTTLHVDLTRPNNEPYDPKTITIQLNKKFSKSFLPIRILSTYLVPNTFHCRREALSRTYMYRLCVIKYNGLIRNTLDKLIPIEEHNRAYFICCNDFDIDKAKDACKLFEGLHDFRTFMGRGSKQQNKITRKVVEKLDIIDEGHRFYTNFSWPNCINQNESDYKFYNIYCKGNAFVYNQVRRTVAALIAAAQGKVSTRDIKFMLEVPSHHSWDPRIKTVPAHGLYLCEVSYSETDRGTFHEVSY